MLEAGKKYYVHLWRRIQGGGGSPPIEFSIWDGSGIHLERPFFDGFTPLAYVPYDIDTL